MWPVRWDAHAPITSAARLLPPTSARRPDLGLDQNAYRAEAEGAALADLSGSWVVTSACNAGSAPGFDKGPER